MIFEKKVYLSFFLTIVLGILILFNYLIVEKENEEALWSKPNVPLSIKLSMDDKLDNKTNHLLVSTSSINVIDNDKHNWSRFVNVYSTNENGDYLNAKLICNGKWIPMSVYDYDIKNPSLVYPYDEENLMKNLEKQISSPNFHFIDLGCGLGLHTLNMACRGYEVIAVDANIENIKRLRQSARQNNFTDLIITINNALADSHDVFILKSPNHRDSARIYRINSPSNISVTGIYIDELIPLIKHKNVIIKIDIEGSEILALRKAKLLFQTFNVLAVFIEWFFIRSDPALMEVIELFKNYHLRPYDLDNKILSIETHKTWPINVVWKP